MILHEMIDESGGYSPQITDYQIRFGTPWEKRFFFIPRKTIGGKWHVGNLYWSVTYYRDLPGLYTYATPKEYFVWKMKHNG
jgi:hypothetical protein